MVDITTLLLVLSKIDSILCKVPKYYQSYMYSYLKFAPSDAALTPSETSSRIFKCIGQQ